MATKPASARGRTARGRDGLLVSIRYIDVVEDIPRLRYVPALDGLRALAVSAVLFFHAQAGFAGGGFLGVSVFFTISGYLITSLLLAEHVATGTVSLRQFYGRRLRRLIPGAYACVAFVLALSAMWTPYQRAHLRGDEVAALSNVANWRFAFASTTYSDLFISSPSPLAHYWSLAIEEQCYVVIPIVAWVALRHGRRTLFAATCALLAVSFVATMFTTNDNLIYNGTHTRAAEILIGVLLAQIGFRAERLRRMVSILGALAFAVLGLLVATVTVNDHWLYRGGLVAVGVLSALAIAMIVSGGAWATVLGYRPLVYIGKISYGLYLVHWPIFVAFSPSRTHLQGPTLAVLRIAISIAVASLSYHLFELRIRQRHVLRSPRRALLAMSVAFSMLLAASLVASPSVRVSLSAQVLSQGATGPIAFGADDSATTAGPVVDAVAQRRHRVLVVGSDRTPVTALAAEGYDAIDAVQPSCPLMPGPTAPHTTDSNDPANVCEPLSQSWSRLIARYAPDVVVISTGALERDVITGDGASHDQSFTALKDATARLTAGFADLNLAFDNLDATGIPYLLADHPRSGDPKIDALEQVRLTHPDAGTAATTPEQLTAGVRDRLDKSSTADGRLHVLVIGDSTSLFMARALSDAAPDRLRVVWAGEEGCPFVRVVELRDSKKADGQWSPSCRDIRTSLPPLIDSVHPDVVLLISTVFELMDQRYPGDRQWHRPGDATYRAYHQSEMDSFRKMLAQRSIPLLIADSPGAKPGPWFTPEMSGAWRLAAWNAQIHSWCDTSLNTSCFYYAGPLIDAEQKNGSMRSDGVHPEIGPLTDLAREVFVEELFRRTNTLRQSMASPIRS